MHTFTNTVSQDTPSPRGLGKLGLAAMNAASLLIQSTGRFAFTPPEMGASLASNGAGQFIHGYLPRLDRGGCNRHGAFLGIAA